jgi:hypothetical protein
MRFRFRFCGCEAAHRAKPTGFSDALGQALRVTILRSGG